MESKMAETISYGAIILSFIIFLALLRIKPAKGRVVKDHPIIGKFLNHTHYSWIWVPMRVYLGFVWLTAGIEKAVNPAWMSGTVIKGFFANALGTNASGKPIIAYGFYRDFISSIAGSNATGPFAIAIMLGEVIVGVMLIFGMFTGIAAFIGAFMNWNFMMAGTASVNPLMFLFSVCLIMAWKTAGYVGLDRWLLPYLGTPWEEHSKTAVKKISKG